MASEMGRSTWRAMKPSVSLIRARKRRRSATRISAGAATTIGSTPSGSAAGGPNRRVSRSCIAVRPRAPPSASSAASASGTAVGASTMIWPGDAAQAVGSMRVRASRSSQPVSARIAAGAISNGTASPIPKTASMPFQFAIAAMPGGAALSGVK